MAMQYAARATSIGCCVREALHMLDFHVQGEYQWQTDRVCSRELSEVMYVYPARNCRVYYVGLKMELLHVQ